MYGPRTPLGLKYQLERERRPFNRGDLYVGMSDTCVRRRLLEHLTQETNPQLRDLLRLYGDTVEFQAAYTGTEDETLELEDAIIKAWRPITNQKGIPRE